MTSASTIFLMFGLVGQWLTAAGSIWLTWWAAQSRDAPPLRVIAMILVVGPALLWPWLTFTISANGYGSMVGRASMIGMLGVGVGVLRAMFLAVWAIVSGDRPGLRIGGAIVAGLLLVGMMIRGLGTLARL